MTPIGLTTRNVKKALLLSLAAGVLACAADSPTPLTQAAALNQPSQLTNAEVRAYATGRRREIELTGTALQMLSRTGNAAQRAVLSAGAAADHVEQEGAATAGMRVAEYRLLVARVDTLLRLSLSLSGPDTSVRLAGSAMHRLDSLRVELTVLRARVNAETRMP